MKAPAWTALTVVILAGAAGCTRPPGAPAQMGAAMSAFTASGFHLRATAPSDRVLPYAMCKAVWFGEKANAATIGLMPALVKPAAAGWSVLDTDVLLNPTSPQPATTKLLAVPDSAAGCRKAWD